RLFQLGNARPLPPRAPSTVHLPTPPTGILGRQQELAAVGGMIHEARLVTLTGPGGSGKTRLAIEAAGAAVEDFPDGVFFVDIAPIRDAALAPASIAAVLGVRDQPDTPLVEAIAAHVGDRAILLVLDNLEQVPAIGSDLS